MNILYITPYVPSLVRVRPYQIIRHIKERGHQVTLATLVANRKEWNDLHRFERYCDKILVSELPNYRSLLNCLAALPSRLPLQSVYSWDAALYARILEQMFHNGSSPKYDLIHVEHLRGSQYGVRLLKQRKRAPIPPIIWDSVDSISYLFRQAAAQSKQGFGRYITRFDLPRTERREGWLTARFDQVLVTSSKDKKALLALSGGQGRVAVLPNGVDLDYFQPGSFEAREPDTLVVSGKMSYHANVSMVLFLAQQVMPRVWAARPQVNLWIVGKDPVSEIRALAEHPNVTVTGMVDSILPYLQKATIAVAPIQYGAGIQNKVLEAMACSTPVIASPVAVSALETVPGENIVVADDALTWRDAILSLLASPQERQKIGEAGRQYVEKRHRWGNIAEDLEQIYAGIINTQTRNTTAKQKTEGLL
ncbi:MAG TPA: glycosyltransferase [Anaerolineales bacterium]|nr:glycosyltransferase [Anaerolineales bacterium]